MFSGCGLLLIVITKHMAIPMRIKTLEVSLKLLHLFTYFETWYVPPTLYITYIVLHRGFYTIYVYKPIMSL